MKQTKNDINVLSIDYDYFQQVDEKSLLKYPDGIDIPKILSEIIWREYYKNTSSFEQIKKTMPQYKNIDQEYFVENIKFDFDGIKKIYNILYKQRSYVPVYISETHKDIVEIIEMNNVDNKKLNIYNIDLHNDCYYPEEELGCGNWVVHLNKKYDMNYILYTKDILSNDNVPDNIKIDIIYDNLENINEKFDLIFICKSYQWLPPHLDKYFKKTFNRIIKKFANVYFKKGVVSCRNISKF